MKRWAIWLAALLLAATLALGAVVFAAQAYSSADDPLISLSYINDVLLPQIVELIQKNNRGEDIGGAVATTPAETTVTEPPVEYPDGTKHTDGYYAVVQVGAGETLYASVHACEVIVRAGDTAVVSPFTVKYEEQGLSDTTEGKELYNGESVPKNHTILIPRDDGRGISVGEGGAWLMVRGDYRIVETPAVSEASETSETSEASEASEAAE